MEGWHFPNKDVGKNLGLKKWIVMPGIVSYFTNLINLDSEFESIQTQRQGEFICVPLFKWYAKQINRPKKL